MGQLTEYSVELLRHMKTFLGVTFRLEQVDEGKLKPNFNPSPLLNRKKGLKINPFLVEGQKLGGAKVKLTCIGVGFQNLAKKTL